MAFKKLDSELKAEKPHGIRDLALAIAVLADKMGQAAQKLETQAVPSAAAGWSMSEDTLLILRQHREAKTAEPPVNQIIAAGLGGPSPEPQKRPVGGEAIAAEVLPIEPDKAQRGAAGGN